MISNDDIKHIYKNTIELLSKYEKEFSLYISISSSDLPDCADPSSELSIQERRISWIAKLIYYHIFVFLEKQNLIQYLDILISNFKSRITNDIELLDAEYIDGIDEYLSKVYMDYWDFLKPFQYLDDNINITLYSKAIDSLNIEFLEKILSNTAFIITNSSVNPKNETSVYNTVKSHIHIQFPKSKEAKHTKFLKALKYYKPDILVPECKAAIEYKYIDSIKRLKEAFSEISDDIKGYSGDPEYIHFYAVFYLTKHFCTQEQFNEYWNEKNNPKEWKAFMCVNSKNCT
ncbi:MAG TPA: hypothetical protein PKM65_19485 [Spirochaetota bacterium]|nr:hypothetical protein [Spirochaetota bacterium]HNT12987.1 hypothetical protein [Spirochaetota bacterium]